MDMGRSSARTDPFSSCSLWQLLAFKASRSPDVCTHGQEEGALHWGTQCYRNSTTSGARQRVGETEQRTGSGKSFGDRLLLYFVSLGVLEGFLNIHENFASGTTKAGRNCL